MGGNSSDLHTEMGPAGPDNKTNNLQSVLQVIHSRAGNTKQIATCPGKTGKKTIFQVG
jgi:hypothetical protein